MIKTEKRSVSFKIPGISNLKVQNKILAGFIVALVVSSLGLQF